MTHIDIIYYCFIGLVIIGGIVAIIILCPKENRLREDKKDCYRFIQSRGKLIKSDSKPSLFENIAGKPIYIEKGPFEIETFFDDVKGADENSYRLGAIFQLYLPERGSEQAAEYLYSVLSDFNQDSVNATLKLEIDTIISAAMKKYSQDADIDSFTEDIRTAVINKLGVFGYDLYTKPTIKISLND